MPKVASHHKWKDADHTPRTDWPEDCMVQWGGGGIVLGKNPYTTAFFEAFPQDGGFIRGEGPTIKEAEDKAFEKYTKFAGCDHQWVRGFTREKEETEIKHGVKRPKIRGKTHYTNGGTICRKCGQFKSTMKPITKLGDWKRLPSASELGTAANGWLAPAEHRDPDSNYRRRIFLRLKVAGIDLPPTPDEPIPYEEEEDHPYILACQNAVYGFIQERGGLDLLRNRDAEHWEGLGILFGVLDAACLRDNYQRWLKKQEAAQKGEPAASA